LIFITQTKKTKPFWSVHQKRHQSLCFPTETFDNPARIVYIDAPETHAPIRPAELQGRKRLKADYTASQAAALAICRRSTPLSLGHAFCEG
jgi:hypothetical protein